MITHWFGCSSVKNKQTIQFAFKLLDTSCPLTCVYDASELRRRIEEIGSSSCGVVVGGTEKGVSDINVAAALVKMGCPQVILVGFDISGSMRSRAGRAGIMEVWDMQAYGCSGFGRIEGLQNLASAEYAQASHSLLHKVSKPEQTAPFMLSHIGHTTDSVQDTLSPIVDDVDIDDVVQDVFDTSATKSTRSSTAEEKLVPAVSRRVLSSSHIPSIEDAMFSPARDTSIKESSPLALSTPKAPQLGHAPILTFVSGRGGIGKTTLAAASACLLEERGYRCALLDFDLSCGNLARAFGVTRPFDLARLHESKHIEEMCARGKTSITSRIDVWGPCKTPEMAEVVFEHIPALIEYVTHNYDIVIADTSTTFTDAVAQIVQVSTRLFIVHDNMPDAIVSLGKTSALAVRLGVARTRICRVENFTNPHSKPDPDFARTEIGLEGACAYRICDGGTSVAELISTGHVHELCESNNTYVRNLQSMITSVLHGLGFDTAHELRKQESPHKGRRLHLALFSRDKEMAV